VIYRALLRQKHVNGPHRDAFPRDTDDGAIGHVGDERFFARLKHRAHIAAARSAAPGKEPAAQRIRFGERLERLAARR
jgi:hypothetical protein